MDLGELGSYKFEILRSSNERADALSSLEDVSKPFYISIRDIVGTPLADTIFTHRFETTEQAAAFCHDIANGKYSINDIKNAGWQAFEQSRKDQEAIAETCLIAFMEEMKGLNITPEQITQTLSAYNRLPLQAREMLRNSEWMYEYMKSYSSSPVLNESAPMLHIGSAPITNKSYEELLLESSQHYDHAAYERLGSSNPTDPRLEKGEVHPFYVCVNTYGQIDDKALSEYPRSRETFEKIFQEKQKTSANRWAAIVEGKPALIYSFDFGDIQWNKMGVRDMATAHAMTAMIAGQLDSMFSDSNTKITYGLCTGHAQCDEIMAILPAEGDRKLLHQFEIVFAKAFNDLPLSQDGAWVKKQYDTILDHIKKELPMRNDLHSWTQELPERAAINSCQTLGSAMGKCQSEWDNAKDVQDQTTLDRLTLKFDVSKSLDTLSTVTNAGILSTDHDLCRLVKLYTSPARENHPAESFYLPLGQLSIALQKMGYEIDYPVSDFLLSYSFEAAKEVKSITECFPKKTLDLQVANAKLRQSSYDLSKDISSRGRSD